MKLDERDSRLLRASFAVAQQAGRAGNRPFGAVLADSEGTVLLQAGNTVVADNDVTGHAELNLIRLAWRQVDHGRLPECTVFASTEPCPMCSAAIYWAGVPRVVYGLSQRLFYSFAAQTSSSLLLPCHEVLSKGARAVEVIGPALEDEALEVHKGFWNTAPSLRHAPPGMSIREATDEDTPILLTVLQAAFEQYRGRLDPPSGVHRETIETIREKLRTGSALLAVVDDEVAGCVFYQQERSHVYLGRLSVLPEYRRRGVGRALIDHVEAQARVLKVPRVQIGVRLSLPNIRAYYERLGYRVARYTAHEGYAEPTSVVMEKELAEFHLPP